jgi:hypothetical protein
VVPGLPKGKKVQLIRGERRVRCLQKLIANNKTELCYDPATKKLERPKNVYEKVICHVVDCDDLMANKIAFSDNEQAVGIGEACTAAYVRKLKNDGLTSDEIMKITGKKASWLRDEESLLTLDKACFNAFVCGEINRTIALELVEFHPSQRQQRLQQIKAFALARHQEKIAAAADALQAAEEKVELISADVETAETLDEKEAARGELIAAQVQADKKQKDLEAIQRQPPKATSKDLHAMMSKSPALTLVKIKKHWEDPLNEFLAAGDFTEIPEHRVRLALRMLTGIKEGNQDIKSILIAE